jgi:hypothetical protein
MLRSRLVRSIRELTGEGVAGMWQLLRTRRALLVARRGWLVLVVLAVIASVGHMSATQHCHTDVATSAERTAVQSAGADDTLPRPTCCAHSVEVGQRTTCTASGDAPVATGGSVPRVAVAGQALAGRSVSLVLSQAQLQRWRH